MRPTTTCTQAHRNPIEHTLFACAVLVISLGLAGLATPAESQALIPAQTIGSSLTNAAATSDAPAVGSSDVYRSPDSRQTLLPKASGAYLRESPDAVGKPQLVVAYYNLTEGLLAGYQSVSGKRILLRGRWRPNGAVNPEVAHLNSATGQIELLMGRSKQLDSSTGQRAKVYEVAGVDFMARLNDARRGRRSSSEPDEIRQFMDSEAGLAFAEAMPVLYSALESLESDPKLAALQAPFGGILTALQLSTGVYTGLDNLDLAIGVTRANSLREACGRGECRYRGRNFTVQNNGLFDVLSKSGAAFGKKAF